MSAEAFVVVATPTCVYVGCPNRQDFDTIAGAAVKFGALLTKTVEQAGLMVVFQHRLQAAALVAAAAAP